VGDGGPATRRPGRRAEPRELEQIPVWSDGALTAAHPPKTGRPRRRAPEEQRTPPSGVDALLDGLSRDQRRAVTHDGGPLLVVAGAGTGKTQVITRRIAWLIATRRARPAEILALTFTDKAAEEMQERVDRLVPYGYTDAAISTFHAFGDRLIRESALELGLPTDVRVLTRPETVLFLRERLFRLDLDAYRPLGDPTRFLDGLAALFSRCKDEDVSPEAYRAYVDRLVAEATAADALASAGSDPRLAEAAAAAADLARRQGEIAAAYARYQGLMAEAGAVDFGDQVSLALRLVRDSPAALQRLRARFRYILVDEFQDTNRVQWELVSTLAEPDRRITVVGDDDQSIYRFRGAAISNILGFLDRYPGARTVVLRRNYRSRAPILDASRRLVRFNDPDRLEVRAGISKRLVAARRGGRPAPVRHHAFATGSEEAEWVAADIAARIAVGGAPRDHAILVRANAEADAFLRSLTMAGIPWRFSGASGLYARPEVRVLLAFLRAIVDPDSTVDVYSLAASEVYGLGGTDLAALVSRARRTSRSLRETLEEVVDQPSTLRLGPSTRSAIERLVGDLRRYADLAHERTTGEVLYAFLRESGLLARYAVPASAADEEALLNVARFFEVVRARGTLLEDDRAAHLVPHLRTLVEAGDDPATADVASDVDAVAVLTVHKAKGLEFPVVYLVCLVAGRFPSAGRREPLELPADLIDVAGAPTGDVHLQEERRLFYVAMTRARDELVLTHAADYGGRRTRRVSPFVLEALDLPQAGTEPLTASPSALERLSRLGASEASPPAAVRASGGPLSLSFYQVDDYLTCPAKYRYVHVLRLPIAPHHAIVYGAALHRAAQELHRRQAQGGAISEEELLEVFDRAWSNEGFVTREHEEARRAAGHAALLRFRAEQLAPGAVVPTYVEKEFSFTYGGDRVRGRWDRVDVVPTSSGGDVDDGGVGGAETAVAMPDDLGGLDLVTPTLPFGAAERVTIVDYKSSDVRDPAQARQRARDSLQLGIYALAWRSATGRLPDAVALHFIGTGLVGTAEVDAARVEKVGEAISRAAAGIRAGAFEATPGYVACSYCAFREICPASAAR
jgi:DNA helicase-2/ATP-dependent DNA helicase PcrA